MKDKDEFSDEEYTAHPEPTDFIKMMYETEWHFSYIPRRKNPKFPNED